jgi:hypothetical protein
VSLSKYTPEVETDPRFPSGKWVGYFLMPHTGSVRHATELTLTFRSARMWGDGRDQVGKFVVEGKYDLADGRCHWLKTYIGRHTVDYQGFNEGKGIWGVWEIPNYPGPPWRAGFHIWPEHMGDPSQPALSEKAELPTESPHDDPVLTPV